MLGTHDLWAFLIASVLLWLTPGPDTIYILGRSIAQGRRAGVISALGIGAGLLIHTSFAAFGLSAILATSAWAFSVIKIAGAVYLVYLGVQLLRRNDARPAASGVTPLDSSWRIFRQALLTNALNPKVAVFFLAFLPQFVDRADPGPLPFLFLGAVFVVGGTAWCLGQAVFAASVTRTMRRNPSMLKRLERLSGCLYILLGLYLLRLKPHTV